MEETLYYRTAEEKDIPVITEIEELCFPDPWSEDLIRADVVGNSISTYVLAEIENNRPSEIAEDLATSVNRDSNELKNKGRTIVGYLGIWVVRDECQINNVAVHPDFRGRGIGKRLLNEVIEITEELGVTYWTLEVRKGNEPGIQLYKSSGFQIDAIRPNYYENGEDAILMSRVSNK